MNLLFVRNSKSGPNNPAERFEWFYTSLLWNQKECNVGMGTLVSDSELKFCVILVPLFTNTQTKRNGLVRNCLYPRCWWWVLIMSYKTKHSCYAQINQQITILWMSSKKVRVEQDRRNHRGYRHCFVEAIWKGVEGKHYRAYGTSRSTHETQRQSLTDLMR